MNILLISRYVIQENCGAIKVYKLIKANQDLIERFSNVNKRMEFTPLKNSIRTADEFSSKLPVTDLNEAPLRGADSNLQRYKSTINE